MADDPKDLTLDFFQVSDAELMALAQMAKRIYWEDMRKLAVNDRETELMASAVVKLQEALADKGFAPR